MEKETGSKAKVGDGSLHEVLEYIHQNIHTRLVAEEVAYHFGYSKWYFCKKFRDWTGKTFVEYVRGYRMQLAATEILSGKKIIDVAMDWGYDSISGFNKAFCKEYGCLPREYRRRTKEQNIDFYAIQDVLVGIFENYKDVSVNLR